MSRFFRRDTNRNRGPARSSQRFVAANDALKSLAASLKVYPETPLFETPDLATSAIEAKLTDYQPPAEGTPQFNALIETAQQFMKEIDAAVEGGGLRKREDMPLYWHKGNELCKLIRNKGWEELDFEERRKIFNFAAIISGKWAYIGIF